MLEKKIEKKKEKIYEKRNYFNLKKIFFIFFFKSTSLFFEKNKNLSVKQKKLQVQKHHLLPLFQTYLIEFFKRSSDKYLFFSKKSDVDFIFDENLKGLLCDN